MGFITSNEESCFREKHTVFAIGAVQSVIPETQNCYLISCFENCLCLRFDLRHKHCSIVNFSLHFHLLFPTNESHGVRRIYSSIRHPGNQQNSSH